MIFSFQIFSYPGVPTLGHLIWDIRSRVVLSSYFSLLSFSFFLFSLLNLLNFFILSFFCLDFQKFPEKKKNRISELRTWLDCCPVHVLMSVHRFPHTVLTSQFSNFQLSNVPSTQLVILPSFPPRQDTQAS